VVQGNCEQDEVSELLLVWNGIVILDVHVVDQDVHVVDQDVHVVDQYVHVVDQDVHVVDQDVAVDDAIHDVRCESNYCVSMIVNGRNGLGAIVLDVHQDGGEVREDIDGIDVCHLIGGDLKIDPKEAKEPTFLKVILAVLVARVEAALNLELYIVNCRLGSKV
jgi:hypothetical protein